MTNHPSTNFTELAAQLPSDDKHSLLKYLLATPKASIDLTQLKQLLANPAVDIEASLNFLTPLAFACQQNLNNLVLKLLLDAKANPNVIYEGKDMVSLLVW